MHCDRMRATRMKSDWIQVRLEPGDRAFAEQYAQAREWTLSKYLQSLIAAHRSVATADDVAIVQMRTILERAREAESNP